MGDYSLDSSETDDGPAIVRAHACVAAADSSRDKGDLERAHRLHQLAAELFAVATSEASDAESISELQALAEQQSDRAAEIQRLLASHSSLEGSRLSSEHDRGHSNNNNTSTDNAGKFRRSVDDRSSNTQHQRRNSGSQRWGQDSESSAGFDDSLENSIDLGLDGGTPSDSVSAVLREYAPNIPGGLQASEFGGPGRRRSNSGGGGGDGDGENFAIQGNEQFPHSHATSGAGGAAVAAGSLPMLVRDTGLGNFAGAAGAAGHALQTFFEESDWWSWIESLASQLPGGIAGPSSSPGRTVSMPSVTKVTRSDVMQRSLSPGTVISDFVVIDEPQRATNPQARISALEAEVERLAELVVTLTNERDIAIRAFEEEKRRAESMRHGIESFKKEVRLKASLRQSLLANSALVPGVAVDGKVPRVAALGGSASSAPLAHSLQAAQAEISRLKAVVQKKDEQLEQSKYCPG